MGLRFTGEEDVTALFDSVTGWAFGPVFDTQEAAERFLRWTAKQGVEGGDVRALNIPDLEKLWDRYCTEREHPRG